MAVVSRFHDPLLHTITASLAGTLAALCVVLFFHERLHPDEVWAPSGELSRIADRLTSLARGASALIAVATVVTAFIHPQWRTQATVPVLCLTFFIYVQERLRTDTKKEPIWTS